MLKNYLSLDEWTKNRSLRRKIDNQQDEKEDSAKNPTTEELAHLARASSALAYLKSRNLHFPYVSKATETRKISSSPSSDPTYESKLDTMVRLPRRYVVPLRKNLIIDGLSSLPINDPTDDKRLTLIVNALWTYSAMGIVYGGLHLAAWNANFVTKGEKWAWRGSGLCMVGLPAAGVIAHLTMKWDSWVARKLRKIASSSPVSDNESSAAEDGSQSKQNYAILFRVLCMPTSLLLNTIIYSGFLLALVCLALYPFARIYVLAESFASLRSVERDVYRTVEWTNFIPHAG